MTKTNFEAAAKFVEFGLQEKQHGRRESASGPGSSLEATAEAQTFLEAILAQYAVTSILDLGCGDWNWMSHVALVTPQGQAINYLGFEANAELVSQLNETYGNANRRFELKDIVTENYPRVDLIIVRDVLFHLPTELVLRVIEKAQSSSHLLLTTTYPDETQQPDIKEYLPIPGWGFRRVNMDLEPFNLAPYRLEYVQETKCTHGGFDRHMALYRFP